MKQLFSFIFLVALTLACHAQQPSAPLPFQVGIYNPVMYYPKPKAPVQPPYVVQDGYTLTFGAHADYTLCLVDENEEVVYTAFVPSSVSTVVLPAYLQGSYEIRLLTDSVYFYGWIDL